MERAVSIQEELKKQYRVESVMEQLPTLDRYVAYDLKGHQSVTLHVLRKTSVVLRQRVIASLQLLREIQHPNLLSVLDFGELEEGRRCYWVTPQYRMLSMPSGEPTGLINSPEELLATLTNILQALMVVHAVGLVHRRIRWEALVSIDGQFCLSDFGVPQYCSVAEEKSASPELSDEKVGDVLSTLEMASTFASSREKHPQASPVDSWFLLADQLNELVDRVRRTDIRTATEAVKVVLDFQLQSPAFDVEVSRKHRRAVVEMALKNIGVHLPVLERVLWDAPPSEKLPETIVLHINHCLDDVFLLDKLFNDLFAKSVYVTVPYGRQSIPGDHPGVVYHAVIKTNSFELLRSGQPIGERSATFSDAMDRLVTRALRDEILPELTDGRRLLIVEDGGYHYQPLRLCLEEGLLSPDSVVGVVEQTMSGAMRCVAAIRDHGVPYPALTLARSDLKMRYEAFFIGRRIVDELAYLLYRYDEFLALRKILIIGYGIIGRGVALSLVGMACDISVVDICEVVLNVAHQDGLEILPNGLSGFFTSEVVVVGATGEASFSLSMLAEFAHSPSNRVFLVSASSKRVEFAEVIQFFEGGEDGRQNFIDSEGRLGGIDSVHIEHNASGMAYLFTCAGRNKTVVLVARGFPVNFYREDGFSLTMGMIDPINAELVLLANHAVESKDTLESNRLYALGCSPLPGLSITEEGVLATWRETRGLVEFLEDAGVWSGFPIHPAEEYLRLRRLDDAEIVLEDL
jgi:hypothetical protein